MMNAEWDKMNKALERLREVSDQFSDAISTAFDAVTSVIDSEQCRTGEAEEKIHNLGRRIEDLEPSSETETPAAVN